MKRILSIALTLILLAAALSGCGGSGTPANSAAPSVEPAAPTPAADPSQPEPAKNEEPAQTISVAALEGGYGVAMWQQVCDAFTAETGIAVELTTDKFIENIIGPAMQGGDFPDVVHLAVGRELGLTDQFVRDRLIADITDVLSMAVPGETALVSDKIAGGFTDNSITNPYGDGKTYLAPMFYSPCGLFYNANLFATKGWKVPTTWDEMWALGETAKAEGYALFTYPTTGYFDTFIPTVLYSVGGPAFFDKVTSYQEGVWDTPEAAQYMEILTKLASYTNPATPAQANDTDFTMNQQMILDDKVLFLPCGTWIVDEMGAAPRVDGFEWGMCPIPEVSTGGGYSYTWFEQAWIPSGAANQDAAKQFIAFLYSDKAVDIFAASNAIQPVTGIADGFEGNNKMFYSLYDDGAKAAMGGFKAFNTVAGLGTVREVFMDPFNALVSGGITAEKWQQDMKAASDQMRANLMAQ